MQVNKPKEVPLFTLLAVVIGLFFAVSLIISIALIVL